MTFAAASAVMRADGTGARLLTRSGRDAVDNSPAWSPDGRWIAFIRTRRGRGLVEVTAADGTGLRTVVDRDGLRVSVDWQPLS